MKTKAKILQVVQLGQPVLRATAKPIKDVKSSEIQELIDNLMVTCEDFDGVGIAAPQVDESVRLFIVASKPNARYPKAPNMKPTAVINPKILAKSAKKKKAWEGCLSIPGIRALVPRATWVKVEYTDRTGKVKQARFTDFVARVFLHEFDHINGILFIDHAKPTEMISEKEYQKLIKKELAKK